MNKRTTMRSIRVNLFLLTLALTLPQNLLALQQEPSIEQLFQNANELVAQQQFKQASAALARIVKVDKQNADAWQMLGYTLQAAGDFDRAIIIHKKAATFPVAAASAYYNLGCVYSLKKDSTKSLEYLEKAIDAGFDNVEILNGDPDWNHARKDSRFNRLANQMQFNATKNREALAAAKAKAEKEESKRKIAEVATPVPIEEPTINGQWFVYSATLSGTDLGEDDLPIETMISDNEIKMELGEAKLEMTYELDTSQQPLVITLTASKEGKTRKSEGILYYSGDEITLCYPSGDGERPAKFESTKENENVVLELRKKDATLDRYEMYGDWEFVNGQKGGQLIKKEQFSKAISINRNEFLIPGSDGGDLSVTYSIDSTCDPVKMDMVMFDVKTGEKISSSLGIIQLKDQYLSVCYDPQGKARPSRFSTTEKDGFFLFTLSRKKEEK